MSGPDDRDYDRDFDDIVAQIEASRMTEPRDGWLNLEDAIDEAESDELDEADWKPAPLAPPSAPSSLAAVGWACAAYVLAVLVLTIVGVTLPPILAYLAIAAFAAAMGIGLWKLPRDRDGGPHDGSDGAVV